MPFSQGLIYDANARLVNVDRSRECPPEILRVVRSYDPRLDLRWDGAEQQWGLWRTSEICDIPVFCCHVGDSLDGRILGKLVEMDTRRGGFDERFIAKMDQVRREEKRRMRDRASKRREELEAVNRYDDESSGAKVADEIVRRYLENGER